MVVNSGNKYASPKYRLVVRFTNKAVIAQIVYAEASGDKTITSAYSTELKRYGLTVGLKNYAAAYCTGLLVARRALKKLGLDELYEGNTEVDGEIKATDGFCINTDCITAWPSRRLCPASASWPLATSATATSTTT